MNEVMHLKYYGVLYDQDAIEMIVDILGTDKYSYKVLKLILDNSILSGISKTTICNSVTVMSKKKTEDNKFVSSKIKMTRAHVDDIINMLIGAGLIYYKESHRERLFYPTQRGLQVIEVLLQKNIIKEAEKEE